MKKHATILFLTLGFALLVSACGGAPAATSTPVTNTPVSSVIAEGHMVPNQSTFLAFLVTGRVESVLVSKGEQVSQGQVLVRLGDREQAQAALAGAQAQVLAAQQAYDILVRTAGLATAQAWKSYMEAQRGVAAAQLAWDKLDQLSIQTDIDTAQADVTTRQNDVLTAQADLSKYAGLAATNPTRKSYEDKLRIAETTYDTAVQKLVDLTNGRDLLQAALNAALAAQAEARRTYDNTRNGPDTDKLALAQAQLDTAVAQAALAQSTLDNYDLKAPFSGTVADLKVTASQMVSPQTWVVALADTSQWYVDTSDLTEMDVVRVSVGQEAKVTADALPGVTMNGVVDSISTAPNVQGGDVVYTVHLRLVDPDPRLLWGMTMEVTFSP
jgi:HlyD family secretion protein